MAFIDESYTARRERFLRIRDGFAHSENKIILGFVDIKEFPIEETDDCTNQIIVMYENGRVDALPTGICGGQIRDYLQLRFFKIKYWCAIPSSKSRKNPCFQMKANTISSDKDIYECR